MWVSIIAVFLTSMLLWSNSNNVHSFASIDDQSSDQYDLDREDTWTNPSTGNSPDRYGSYDAEWIARIAIKNDRSFAAVARTNRINNWIIVQNVDDAIEYLHDSGLTRFASRGEFMHDQWLRRDEAAAFFVRFVRDVLGRDTDWIPDYLDLDADNDSIPDSAGADHCQFSDLDQAHDDLREEIQESCRLGLFRGHAWRFMPTDEFSNAHAMTVLIRLIEWMQDEPEENWAREYFARAQRAWLVQSLAAEQGENLYRPITRGDVAKMIEWSAVYIASRDNEHCTTIDVDGDGVPTRYERCVIQWELSRAQRKDMQARRNIIDDVCEWDWEDCDDEDLRIWTWTVVKPIDKSSPTLSRVSDWNEIDKSSPYIIMARQDMPCDWATCPDWSCVATSDECVWFIDHENIMFVTSSGGELWCRGRNAEQQSCPRDRSATRDITMVTGRSFTQTYREYLIDEFTQRLSLPWANDVVYSLTEWVVSWEDWEMQIVVIVEPSERGISAQANADHDHDDTELVPACITPSWQGECPENKTCSDGTTVDCTCNTGICLCKMCGEKSTLEIK